MNTPSLYDVIIIGAGASGLMCAYTASRRKRSVLMLDHAEQPGNKITISGGGRANFTNHTISADNYISNNPHFATSALKRYTQHDFLAFMSENAIDYEEREEGQYFCTGPARQIVSMLLEKCQNNAVKIVTTCKVRSVKKNNIFTVETDRGPFNSQSVVIATGGLSYHVLGASDFGYRVAHDFGITVTHLSPGLVPLLCKEPFLSFMSALSGVSLRAEVHCNNISFCGALLFTHKGLSGPAILQISNYWQSGMSLTINLLPGATILSLVKAWQAERPNVLIKNLLATLLPKRVVSQLLPAVLAKKNVNQCSSNDIQLLESTFQSWHIMPYATEGYPKAEVTNGGINTDEISSKTFEAKKVPGLYFIGEVLDVTGALGGYNLQWAWSSGYCAGLFV